MEPIKAVIWKQGRLYLLDQTLLPLKKETRLCRTYEEVAEAIKTMIVRGAPAIGVAAAYGLVLAARASILQERQSLNKSLERAKEVLAETRPTAVNLFWALERMEKIWQNNLTASGKEITELLEAEAIAIAAEDEANNRRIGRFGNELIPKEAKILTHCNAGALATAGYGTALGVIRAADAAKKQVHVYVNETRPLLQGARLTAWELTEENIPATLITDSMAGSLMEEGKIDLVIVGADRIAVNGDAANKIGTYSVAVLASYHHIPFYVAAPLSTFDLALSKGKEIPIEQRQSDEVRSIGGIPIAPRAINVYNPSFDVTPAMLITAIITEFGILKPPYRTSIAEMITLKSLNNF